MPLPITSWIILAFAGVATSTVSGVIGAIGGSLLIGVMTLVLPPPIIVPVHGVAQLWSNLSRAVLLRSFIRWRIFLIYSIPLVLGILIAAQIWKPTKLWWFKPTIGIFLLFMLVWRRLKPKFRHLPLWTFAILGFGIGLITIFVGATGPLLIPFFLRDDFKKEETIANQAACQAWGHLLKLPAFTLLGFNFFDHVLLLAVLTVSVIIGSYIGRHTLDKIPQEKFTRVIEIFIAYLSIYLLITGIYDYKHP